MANQIVFKLSETKLPGNKTIPCLTITDPSTSVKFGEKDHLILVPDSSNKAPVTLLFDAKAAAIFDSPPAQVNLLPNNVSAAGISPAPVDRFVLKIRKDLDGTKREYDFDTEPSDRCRPGDLADVVVEC